MKLRHSQAAPLRNRMDLESLPSLSLGVRQRLGQRKVTFHPRQVTVGEEGTKGARADARLRAQEQNAGFPPACSGSIPGPRRGPLSLPQSSCAPRKTREHPCQRPNGHVGTRAPLLTPPGMFTSALRKAFFLEFPHSFPSSQKHPEDKHTKSHVAPGCCSGVGWPASYRDDCCV